jgi:hypothetical protein
MMSTDYRIEKKIKVADFLCALAKEGIIKKLREPSEDGAHQTRVLTDGNNYLTFYAGDDGTVQDLTRYAWCRAPGRILDAIAEAFDTEIWSNTTIRTFDWSQIVIRNIDDADVSAPRRIALSLDAPAHVDLGFIRCSWHGSDAVQPLFLVVPLKRTRTHAGRTTVVARGRA